MSINLITNSAGPMGPKRKRVGRGIGSHGKTSGRGHKGAGSRSGTKSQLAREGGQMPMFRRVAKRGFSSGDYSACKKIFCVNVGSLSLLGAEVTLINSEVLINAGVIPRRTQNVRVLGGGELIRRFDFQVNYVTRSAADKIRKAGGSVVLI